MPSNPAKPHREIGFVQLYLIGISSMVGSSWLFTAMYAAQFAGPGGIVSVGLAGLIMFLIGIVYAELAGIVPVSGGSSRIPHITHGDYASFTAAVLNWLGFVAIAPLEVMAIVEYTNEFLPFLAKSDDGTATLTAYGILACIPMLLFFVIANTQGVKRLMTANSPIAIWKILVPITTALVLLLVSFNPKNFGASGGFLPFGWSGVLAATATSGATLAFVGFRTMLEMAGEVRNPSQAIPRAMLAAIASVVAIYVLLAVAFVGALSPEQLAGGWSGISDHTGSGPFAAIALGLGLTLLAYFLYVDSVVSPGGTGLIFTGVGARTARAISEDGHAPQGLGRLNRQGVPATAVWANLLIGLVLLLPFPGWQAMMTVVTGSLLLSLGLGPIGLVALRAQAPDAPRSFRLPAVWVVATIALILSSFVVYWAGWDTVRLLMATVVVAWLALPLLMARLGNRRLSLAEVKALAWLGPYCGAILLVSWLGNHGGLHILPPGLDLSLLAIACVLVLAVSYRLRLPNGPARAALAKAIAEQQSETVKD